MMEASDRHISDHHFRLSDGKDVRITIYEGRVQGTMGAILYDATIGGLPVEQGCSVSSTKASEAGIKKMLNVT